MSGELTLEKTNWMGTLLAVLLACAVTVVLMLLFLPHLGLTGFARGAVAALGAFVIFRLLYPMTAGMFPGGREETTWMVTADKLVLGQTEIPLDTIKTVHCWPNRDALGQKGRGWTVNIETTGKNTLLRSCTKEQEAKQSARQLRALVTALGYGSAWAEEEE